MNQLAKTSPRPRRKRRKSGADRHAFSILLGLIVGTCGFYASRSALAKSATS